MVVPRMVRLAPLMLVVYTSIMTSLLGQLVKSLNNDNPPLCCKSQCGTQVKPESVNLQDIIKESPSYVQVEPPSLYTIGLDNVCHTYFKNADGSYTLFTGLRYSNGSRGVQMYSATSLSGYLGVIRHVNPAQDSDSCTFVYDDVYLGSACPGFRVYYRNYNAGPCDILGNISQINADFIYGDSTSRDSSEYCKSQVAAVANSQQLRGTQLVGLPNLLDRCCVTQFNGVSCVNADRVLPQDSIILPNTGTAFQMCSYVLNIYFLRPEY